MGFGRHLERRDFHDARIAANDQFQAGMRPGRARRRRPARFWRERSCAAPPTTRPDCAAPDPDRPNLRAASTKELDIVAALDVRVRNVAPTSRMARLFFVGGRVGRQRQHEAAWQRERAVGIGLRSVSGLLGSQRIAAIGQIKNIIAARRADRLPAGRVAQCAIPPRPPVEVGRQFAVHGPTDIAALRRRRRLTQLPRGDVEGNAKIDLLHDLAGRCP